MKIKKIENLNKELKFVIAWVGTLADGRRLNAFIVGGLVRDILLGIKNFDLDIVVEGDGIEFAQSMALDKSARLIKHRQFGTATVILPDGFKIDVATARKENYEKPAALPQVTPGVIRDDLFRRDFSVNAMAISINKNNFAELFDYFDGQRDLQKKKIRALHDLSFIDDPTRIIRAVRFEQRLGFKLDAYTLSLIKAAVSAGMLFEVSPQRVWDELMLMCKESKPKRHIIRLDQICGLKFIHPKIKLDKKLLGLFASLDKAIQRFQKAFPKRRLIDIWLMYFALILYKLNINEVNSIIKKYDIGKGNKKRIASFALCNKKITKFLARSKLRPSQIFSILEPLSYEVILLVKAISNRAIAQRRIEDFLKMHNGMQPYIKGDDLLRMGMKPGAHFKKILTRTLHAKIDKGLKNKSDELQFVRRLIKKK